MKGKIGFVLILLVVCGAAIAALIAVQGVSRKVEGSSDGAKALEARLKAALGTLVAEEPPLRVFAMMPEKEGGFWRWKVEATVRPGRSPEDAEGARALDRAGNLCLRTGVGMRPCGGALLVLHQAGKADWTRTVGGEGRAK